MNSTVKRILGRLRLDKIASVDHPCQEGATVALIKRASELPNETNGQKLFKSLQQAFTKSAVPMDDMDGDEGARAFNDVLGDQILDDTFWNAWYKGTNALEESLYSIVTDSETNDKSSAIQDSLKQFADYIEGILPGDIGKAIATGIVVSAGQAGIPLEKGNDMSVELMKALGLSETASEADVLKAIADKDAALAKAAEDLEKAKMPAALACADDDEAEVKKSIDAGDAFRTPEGTVITKKAVGDGIFTVLKGQNDRILKAEADLTKARELEDQRSFAKRATEIGCTEEFGSTLRKAYSGDAAAQTELEKQIAGLNKQVDAGQFFSTFGKSGEAGTASEEFTAKVAELKKANPALTDAQAYSKVYSARENADIVKRMKVEQTAA